MGRDLPRSSNNSPWTLWLPWRDLRSCRSSDCCETNCSSICCELLMVGFHRQRPNQMDRCWAHMDDPDFYNRYWNLLLKYSFWVVGTSLWGLLSSDFFWCKYRKPSNEGCRSWRWAAGDPWVSAQGRWLFGSQKSLEVGGKPQSQWLTSDQGTNFQTVLQALWRFTSQYCLSFLPKSNQEADAEVGEAADLEDDFKMERVVMMLMLVDVVVVMVKHVLYGRHLGQISVNYQSVSSYQLCTLSRRCRKKSL